MTLVRPTVRRLVDADGNDWDIWEEPADHVPGSRGDRCLICDSWNIRRRLWRYPADWLGLSDKALRELCIESSIALRPA